MPTDAEAVNAAPLTLADKAALFAWMDAHADDLALPWFTADERARLLFYRYLHDTGRLAVPPRD